jgi:hypothetical protein
MELEGDSPAPRLPVAPVVPAGQNIHVTPENVVALAAMFRDCADNLTPEVGQIEDDLPLAGPWMDDPVSRWARHQFDEYFVYGERSFARVVQAEYDQYTAIRDALVATAKQYGLTEELIAAGFIDVAAT